MMSKLPYPGRELEPGLLLGPEERRPLRLDLGQVLQRVPDRQAALFGHLDPAGPAGVSVVLARKVGESGSDPARTR